MGSLNKLRVVFLRLKAFSKSKIQDEFLKKKSTRLFLKFIKAYELNLKQQAYLHM